MERSLDFRVLGPLEVRLDGSALELGGRRLRSLLAVLLLRANEVVSSDSLIEAIWGSDAPPSSINALHVHVSQLRKLLPEGLVVTRQPGYELRVDPDRIDVHRFEQLAARARRALADSRPSEAATALRDALDLWQGSPLADLAFEPFAQTEIQRLEELRLQALEDRIDAELALGGGPDLVGELRTLVADHPLRERLRRQLMLALYRAGRQAEALEEYQNARRTLVDELGIEPSQQLQELERAILNQETALAGAAGPRPPRARRAAVPVPPTPLTGREAELEDVCVLVRRPDVRLVTLTGAAGVGKTRLALEAARELEAEFDDGAAFVALEPVSDPALVGPAIAKGVGAAGDELEDELRDRSLLLVLDGFEHLTEAAPLLAYVLGAAPGVKLIVTSRALLRVSGEHELSVPPLARAPSVELFVQRAQAAKHDFALTEGNEATVAELCARLDGLPLAIELAAARVRVLSPEQLLERLTRRLDVLTGGTRDAPLRHQTIRAALDASYELLEEDERKLFAYLGVFAGGCTLEAAEAVGAAEVDVLECLASLVDKSLLRRAVEGRFAMLETIREYAVDRLAESGSAGAVRRRQLEFYLDLVETAEPELKGADEAVWLERLEAEHANVHAVLAFALDAGDGESALRLCAALRRFWQLRGHLFEGRRALDAALAVGADAPPSIRTKALNGAGILAGEQGDFDAAAELFERSLELAHELGDRRRIGSVATNLGNLALFRGDYDRAYELYEQGAETAREMDDLLSLASVLEDLGWAALGSGRVDDAVATLEESVAASRETGEPRAVSASLRALARALMLRGDTQRAIELLAESLPLARGIGEPRGVADCLEALGGVAVATGDPRRAATLFGAADSVRTAIGARRYPSEERWFEDDAALAREQIGAEAFAAAHERGLRLSADEAVELALPRERHRSGGAVVA